MEKQIFLDDQPTNFWIEDTGRLRNGKTQRWLKGGINKDYHFYSLYFKGKQYIKYTHRLVAEYFIPNPDNLPIVHHIDGNKTNNFYKNLQWVSTEKHSETTIKQKNNSNRSISNKDYNENEIAQFRSSPYYATKDGRILNLNKNIEIKLKNSGNYLRFQGNYNLEKKYFLVHRVVWEAFNGEIPKGYDIDHIDGNLHNNRLDNLQAISHGDNLLKRDTDYSYTVNNFYYDK